jgi:hypothetical protein
MATAQKIQPSPKQIETFEMAIKMWPDAKIQAEMDEECVMWVYVTDDELTTVAPFGIDGNLCGDWR